MPPIESGRQENRILVGEREYLRAYGEVEELADATIAIDADLLRMARGAETFDARCRAARALVLRTHAEAPAILASLIRSDIPAERYVAWGLCKQHADRVSSPPIRAASALERLSAEPSPTVVPEIIRYLGAIKAREAIPVLLEWTRAGRHASEAVWALGDMRATEAVPIIIASGADHGYKLRSLGRIATREAVDYVLAHIDSYGAMDALVDSGDPRALPAVEAELARLRALPADRRDLFDERQARIAQIRLKAADPTPALLDLAEDTTADLELRRSAVRYVRPSYAARLAKLYARESDPGILGQCLMAFRSSRAPGVTEGMLHHAQVWQAYQKDTDPAPLVHAINRRLGTAYATLEEVRALATERGIR